MYEEIIDKLIPIVDKACFYLPKKYREDIKQDIYLKLLNDLARLNGNCPDKFIYCKNKIKDYRRRSLKKYTSQKEITGCQLRIDNSTYEKKYSDYTIKLDLDKIVPYLSEKENLLLNYLLLNGTDTPYKEICELLDLKYKSSALRSIRSLFNKIQILMNDSVWKIEKSIYFRNQRKK